MSLQAVAGVPVPGLPGPFAPLTVTGRAGYQKIYTESAATIKALVAARQLILTSVIATNDVGKASPAGMAALHRMSGDVDYLIRAVVPDIRSYDEMYKEMIASVDLYDVSSSFSMETIKYTTALPLDHL